MNLTGLDCLQAVGSTCASLHPFSSTAISLFSRLTYPDQITDLVTSLAGEVKPACVTLSSANRNSGFQRTASFPGIHNWLWNGKVALTMDHTTL